MRKHWKTILYYVFIATVLVFCFHNNLTWHALFWFSEYMVGFILLWVGVIGVLGTLVFILVARAFGLITMQYMFGPFVFARTQRGLSLRFSKSFLRFDAPASPIQYDTRVRYKLLVLLLVLSAVHFILAMWLWVVFPFAREWGFTSRLVALEFCFLGALRVMRLFGLLQGDRNYIGMLLRNDSATARYCAMHYVVGLSRIGQRPRDWSPGLMAMLIALPDASPDAVWCTLLMYRHALDIGDMPVATWYLQRVLSFGEQIPPLYRPWVYGEAAFYEAFYRGDSTSAKEFRDRVDTKNLDAETRARIDAAIVLTEGQSRVAWDRALEGLAALEKSTDFGFSRVETEWFNAIMACAMNMVATSSDATEKIAY